LLYFEEHIFQRGTGADNLAKVLPQLDLFLKINVLFLKLVLQTAHLFVGHAQRLFRLFPVSNVHARAYVPQKFSGRREAWRAGGYDPTKSTVRLAKPELHAEQLAAIERIRIGFQALLKIIGMNSFLPTVADGLLQA